MSREENDNLGNDSHDKGSADTQTAAHALKCLRYTAATDIGMRREENQDSYGVIENSNFRFFIVADGMGGVQGGATASKMAVSIVEQYLKDKKQLTDTDIRQSITVANKLIFEKGAEDSTLNGMGTTFVGIAFVANKMFVINVGDSRAYCIRKNYVKRLTEDHTLVMELVRSGTISVEQASNHPVSHMLTRSLGPTPEIEIDCHVSQSCPMPDDCYLLCSDGLYNMVAESEMLDIINENGIDQATEMLIELANQRGGTDNITLILIKTNSDFPYDSEIAKVADEEIAQYAHLSQGSDGDYDGESSEPRLDSFDPFAVPQLDEDLKKFRKAPAEGASNEAPSSEETASESKATEETKDTDKEQKKEQVPEESIALKAAEVTEEEGSKRSTQSIVVSGVMAGIIGGALVMLMSKLLFMGPSETPITSDSNQTAQEEPSYNIPVPKMPNIVKNDPMIVSMAQDPKIPDNTQYTNTDVMNENAASGNAIANLEKRREKLLLSIEDTRINIERFKNPSASNIQADIATEEKKYNSLSESLKHIRSEIDTATRKLAIWYGRKTRIKESDLTNLASEVAVSSEDVRKKKEEFELASWNYLKESETLRYMPSDVEQRKKVDQLIEVRSKKIQEMSEVVNQAIDREIKAVEKGITDFTIQREKLQDQLDYAERNLQYLRILNGSDEAAKDEKKGELENMLLSLESELNELQNLLPVKQEQKKEKIAPEVKEDTPGANKLP